MANAEEQVKRNQEIMRLWRRGVSLSQIGLRVGLTKERVAERRDAFIASPLDIS